MFNPEDQTGGDTQLNTEQSPMNISDAGKAFFDSLSGEESPTSASEAENDPNYVDIPMTDGSVDNNNTPATGQTFDANALEAIKSSIIAEIQSLKGNAESQPQAEEEQPGELQNDTALNDDEFMERFSENPVQAVMELANKIADEKVSASIKSLGEKIQPLLDESEKITFQNKVKETIGEFISNEEYADAHNYFPQMAQAIREKGLPQDDINSYVSTYKDVALAEARANRGKSLDDYLSDDGEISKVVGNEKVRNAVIEQYLKGIQNGAKPQVITGGGNTSTPATPPTDIKTFADAHKAFRNQL